MPVSTGRHFPAQEQVTTGLTQRGPRWNTAAEINTNTDGAIWLASGRCSLPRRYQAFHRAGLRDSQVSDAAVSRIPPVSSPLAVGLARLP